MERADGGLNEMGPETRVKFVPSDEPYTSTDAGSRAG